MAVHKQVKHHSRAVIALGEVEAGVSFFTAGEDGHLFTHDLWKAVPRIAIRGTDNRDTRHR